MFCRKYSTDKTSLVFYNPYMGIKALQNKIGKKLKYLRLEKELSQESVAYEVKISRDHLSNIENGKHSINLKTLYKLAEFFKVDIVYFFK